MKVLRFVANISYNDVCKLFSVLWVETAFEDVLNTVVQEFGIPHDEATENILCDLQGTSHTIDSFEEDVYRSISEGRIPKFRVITQPISDNAVTSSSNQSGCEEDVEQQVPQETDFSSRAIDLLSNCRSLDENLNKAENRLRPSSLNRPEVRIDQQQRELENRKAKLDLFLKALLEFESSLMTKEEILHQRDIDLNELRKRLNSQEEKLKNREVKITCRKSEVASQYYSSYQQSSSMNTTRQHLDEHSYASNPKEAVLNDVVKPKRKRCRMEAGSWDLDETFNEGASTSNQQRSRALSKSRSASAKKMSKRCRWTVTRYVEVLTSQ